MQSISTNLSFRRIMKAFILSSTVVFAVGCSKQKDNKPADQAVEFKVNYQDYVEHYDSKVIAVTDEAGVPLANAQVLIGTASNQPFDNNFLTTDANGFLAAPEAWSTPLPVTVSVAGYVRVTYFEQVPSGQIFKLKKMETLDQYELSGSTTNFQIKNSDGIADFGMVLPTLDRKTIFNFNISTVISNRIDKTEIAGRDVEMPSNITFPKQKESYFIPITLNKPTYRVYFRNPGSQLVFAARGQFPFKKMVDEMRSDKHFSEMISLFNIQGGSLKALDVNGPKTRVDLPVNELTFNQKLTMKSPSYSSSEYLLAAAIGEYQGYMFPTDVKSVGSQRSQALTIAASADPAVPAKLLTVLQKKGDSSADASLLPLSAALVDFTNNVQPEMIPVPEKPVSYNLEHIAFKPVTSPESIARIGSYAAISKVDSIKSGSETVEIKTKVWEAYMPGWATEVKLPTWPEGFQLSGKKVWEAAFIGSNQSTELRASPSVYETATHATYSTAEFQ